VANHAGLKLNLRLHHLTVLNELLNVEHCEGLSSGDKECVISDVTARADAAAVAEDEVAWVRFGFVGWGFEKAFGPEGHGLRVDGGVVGEPPRFLSATGWIRTFHRTYQVLGNSMAPLGILYPWQTSSAVLVWGKPMGATGCQRCVSFITAMMYGKLSRSALTGSRPLPMTRSSSSWAFFCTSGNAFMAKKKVISEETVYEMVSDTLTRLGVGNSLCQRRP